MSNAWTGASLGGKARALSVHLAISALIFIPVLYLIRVQWFPPPLFQTDGGWQGLRLVLLIHMTLGPALTFLVFDPAKTRKALVFDFTFIGLVQLAALAFGTDSVSQTRPQAVAFVDDAFYAVPQAVFARQGIPDDAWARFGAGPQAWVHVRQPKPDENARFEEAVRNGITAEAMFFLYEPLAAGREQMLSKAVHIPPPEKMTPEFRSAYDAFVRDHGGNSAGFSFLKLYGGFRNALVAVDAGGNYAGYISIDPRAIRR